MLTASCSLYGQTASQQAKAETYYNSKQLQQRYTNSWFWLFGPASSSTTNDQKHIVSWGLDDDGWYTGQGKDGDYSGYGVQYKRKDDSYIFSNWKNTKPNCLCPLKVKTT